MARALQEEMRDAESKKRSLEEQLDHMNAELSSLKQQEQKAQGKFPMDQSDFRILFSKYNHCRNA